MLDRHQFEQLGYAVTKPILTPTETAHLIELIEQNTNTEEKRGGIRDIMHRLPELQQVAHHPAVRSIVDDVLGQDAFIVRTTLFDKTDAANWRVPWHQDVTIAVSERMELDGYGPWSTKEGITHVQPPTEVLDRIVTVRIHLDPCPSTNGALRVMPGTHKLGRINQNDAPQHVSEEHAVCCEAEAGAALVMRPLLLHASSPSTHPDHRRVLHFDFATGELPEGLNWKMR
jgi:ectoine hydroxylase-related dioxygenase (phytanoyl-CoA dioxygenase family)